MQLRGVVGLELGVGERFVVDANDGGDGDSGQGVCDRVVLPRDVAEDAVKL